MSVLKEEPHVQQRKAFVFESAHVIEIVTKLFLVIQNAAGKAPEVQIANESVLSLVVLSVATNA